jgi:hypothetical protein
MESEKQASQGDDSTLFYDIFPKYNILDSDYVLSMTIVQFSRSSITA